MTVKKSLAWEATEYCQNNQKNLKNMESTKYFRDMEANKRNNQSEWSLTLHFDILYFKLVQIFDLIFVDFF